MTYRISLLASECPAAVHELIAAGMKIVDVHEPRGFGRVLGFVKDDPVYESCWYDIDVEPA